MITYYLGAGASANCVPIVDQFRDDFKLLKNCYVEGQSELFSETRNRLDLFKALAGNYESVIEPHPTIDIFAKKLYLKSQRLQSQELSELKKWLLIFYNIIQYARPVDERYVKLFASLIETYKQSLPSNINIITWNYDFQLELAITDFNRPQIPFLDNIHDYLHLFPSKIWLRDYCIEDDNIKDNFTVTRLNGSALLYILDNNELKPIFWPDKISSRRTYHELHGEQLTIDEEVFNSIYDYMQNFNEAEKSGKNYKEITYCWEDNKIARIALQRAIKVAESTTELYIVGYSFPFVNRRYDDAIFQSMNNLERVIIQDPYMEKSSFEYIKKRLHKIFPRGNKVEIEYNDYKKEFILPEQIYRS